MNSETSRHTIDATGFKQYLADLYKLSEFDAYPLIRAKVDFYLSLARRHTPSLRNPTQDTTDTR